MADPESRDDFASQAAGPRTGLARELADFLKETRKWWLAPILIAILALGLLVVLGGSPAGPFLYALF